MTFDGSAEDFAMQRPSVQVSWSRQPSRDISSNEQQQQQQYSNNQKPLPLTPFQTVEYQQSQ